MAYNRPHILIIINSNISTRRTTTNIHVNMITRLLYISIFLLCNLMYRRFYEYVATSCLSFLFREVYNTQKSFPYHLHSIQRIFRISLVLILRCCLAKLLSIHNWHYKYEIYQFIFIDYEYWFHQKAIFVAVSTTKN